ncbi:hypothetical protein B0H63DRAFT_55003 [Podospora didyma]|uniref:Reelin domain-containing protein n=1 Tax=Podospora didyma TaxID=330526 RepID=A0AAE0U8S5_9PEZI|nr:hypothetical protein B0H63DRAFT_55003 [Podospora didyma]
MHPVPNEQPFISFTHIAPAPAFSCILFRATFLVATSLPFLPHHLPLPSKQANKQTTLVYLIDEPAALSPLAISLLINSLMLFCFASLLLPSCGWASLSPRLNFALSFFPIFTLQLASSSSPTTKTLTTEQISVLHKFKPWDNPFL